MSNQLLHSYKNGNYTVNLFADGTKEKFTDDNFFKADFPDSMDLKITNYCDANCPMCHENSNICGKHANLDAPFLNTLPKGIELAIGGGNPLSHPDLLPFLKRMKNSGIICNITVNEKHLLSNNALIDQLIEEKLVWGVGVSITEAHPQTVRF
jgi:MoaA/NifB/PqqE/SkfB family radical SAM enzyme